MSAISSWHGGRRFLPVCFTEHGALMALMAATDDISLARTFRMTDCGLDDLNKRRGQSDYADTT